MSPLLALSNISFAAIDLLPNLQPKPPYELSLYLDTQSHLFLKFSVLTWNSGRGPMRIEGGQIDTVNHIQLVSQRVFRNDKSSYLRDAGYFIHHDGHGHIHCLLLKVSLWVGEMLIAPI